MTVAVESNSSKSNCCCASTSYGCSNHVTSNKEKTSEEYHNATSMCASSQNNLVALATAVVQIKDSRGNYHPARALLDSGSQINLISEEIVQKLRLEKENSELNIVGVGNNAKRITKSINTYVKWYINEYEFPGQFYVMKSIIHKQPSVAIDK